MTKKNKGNKNCFFVFWVQQGLVLAPTYLNS